MHKLNHSPCDSMSHCFLCRFSGSLHSKIILYYSNGNLVVLFLLFIHVLIYFLIVCGTLIGRTHGSDECVSGLSISLSTPHLASKLKVEKKKKDENYLVSGFFPFIFISAFNSRTFKQAQNRKIPKPRR